MTKNISKKVNISKVKQTFSKYLSKDFLKNIAKENGCDDIRERDLPIDRFTYLAILGNSLGSSICLKSISDAAIEWNIVEEDISPQRISQQIDERGYKYFKTLYEHLRDFALSLPRQAKRKVLSHFRKVNILDASSFHLCDKLFCLYKGKRGNAGLKIHARFNLDYLLPVAVVISDGNIHDNMLAPYDETETGILYIMDRGYTDYRRYSRIINQGNDFVSRVKKNICCRIVKDLNSGKVFSKKVFLEQIDTKDSGELDLLIELTTGLQLRLIKYYDEEAKEYYSYLTSLIDNEHFSPDDIRAIYKDRWQIEIFFRDLKYITGSVRIVYQTENRIKAQIYSALCYYLIVRVFIIIACIKSKQSYSFYSLKYSCRQVKLGFIKTRKENIEIELSIISEIVDAIIEKGVKAS